MKKLHLNGSGYLHVVLHKNGTSKTYNVHKLIVLTFLGTYSNRYQVNHKDGNKLNNCVSNLEYTTPRENTNLYHDTQIYSSKYRGVCWNYLIKKWQVRISINGKRIHLGYFDIEINAHCAYQNALNAHNNGESIDPFLIKFKPAQFISTIKGICWNKKNQSWMVRPTVNGKQVYIGCFKIHDEAIISLNEIMGSQK